MEKTTKTIYSTIKLVTNTYCSNSSSTSIDVNGYTFIDIKLIKNFNNSYSIKMDSSNITTGSYDISNVSNITIHCEYKGQSSAATPGGYTIFEYTLR